MIPRTTVDPVCDAHTITDLMAAGDDACMQGRADALATAARLLAACVAAPIQVELQAVADACGDDPATAFRRWTELVADLRVRLVAAPDPRPAA